MNICSSAKRTSIFEPNENSMLPNHQMISNCDDYFHVKTISTSEMICSDFSSLFPCFLGKKYIPVSKDGMCLFRCILAIKFYNEDFAHRIDLTRVKSLSIKYLKDELIMPAIKSAFEFCSLQNVFSEVEYEKIKDILIENIDLIWIPDRVLNCFNQMGNSAVNKENASIFSDAFFTAMIQRLRNDMICKWGNHYVLDANKFNQHLELRHEPDQS